MIGSTLGGWVARRMSLRIFRYAVLFVIIGGSASLLIRETGEIDLGAGCRPVPKSISQGYRI